MGWKRHTAAAFDTRPTPGRESLPQQQWYLGWLTAGGAIAAARAGRHHPRGSALARTLAKGRCNQAGGRKVDAYESGAGLGRAGARLVRRMRPAAHLQVRHGARVITSK